MLGPAADMLPCPVVHPDDSSLPTFAGADQHRPRLRLEICLCESERFADPQSGAPQDRDQPTSPIRILAWPGLAHRQADLLDRTADLLGSADLCSAARNPPSDPASRPATAHGR